VLHRCYLLKIVAPSMMAFAGHHRTGPEEATMKAPTCTLLPLALLWVADPGTARAGEPGLAAKARAVLQAHCFKCHGQEGAAKGGFGHVLDREKLVKRGQLLPGNVALSELYRRVAKGELPPAGKPS